MQFNVYKNKNSSTKKRFPYLLDVQARLLESLGTRVVVPLAPEDLSQSRILTQLTPVFQIRGKGYVAVTPQMAGIAKRDLGGLVGNLAESRPEIIAALDLLFTGV